MADKGFDDWNCGTSYHPCRTLGAKWSETFGNASTGRRVDRVQVIVQTNLRLRDTELVNPYSGDHVVYLEFLDHEGAVQLTLVNLTFYRVIFEVKTADISFTLEGCHFDASGIYVYSTNERSIHDVMIDGCEFYGKFGTKHALRLEETGGVSLVHSQLHDIEVQTAVYCFESDMTIEDTTLENVTYNTAIIQLDKNCKMALRRITMADAKYNSLTKSLGPIKDMNAAIRLSKNASVTIVSSNFTASDVPIKAERSTVYITGSEFSGNSAVDGGALEVSTVSNASIHSCVFRNNSAKKDAGAILVTINSTLNASDCTFEDNACDSDGGALKVHLYAVVNLTNCVFEGNRAKRHHAGAVFLDRRSNMTSHNTSYTRNVAAVGGGAIMMIDHSRYNATGGHFTDNVASNSGTGFNLVRAHVYQESASWLISSAGLGFGFGLRLGLLPQLFPLVQIQIRIPIGIVPQWLLYQFKGQIAVQGTDPHPNFTIFKSEAQSPNPNQWKKSA